jgi:hypothetical protein
MKEFFAIGAAGQAHFINYPLITDWLEDFLQ